MRQDRNDKGYIIYYKNSALFLRRQLFLNRATAMSPQTRNIPKVKKKVQYIHQSLSKDKLTELIKKHCCFL